MEIVPKREKLYRYSVHDCNLSAKKLKLFITDSDSKENENYVDVTGWMLTSYAQQNKMNKTDNDLDG